MAFNFLNPFRRRPDRTREAIDSARDLAFDAGERARQEAARQEQERCEDVRRELDWRRQEDERELREALEATEIPPRVLSEEEAWAESGEWLPVSSSNVAAIAYDAEDERLLIEYKDGSSYAYQPVNMPMAIDFYRAGSKGTWVWDHLRERGTVFGYKIPYTHLSGPSQKITGQELRKWLRTEETRRKHGQIPASGRDFHGNPIRPRDVR